MVIKNVDAVLAGPVVGAVTENAMAIHPDGVVPDNTGGSLTTIHLDGAKRPLVVLVDLMEGTNGDSAVVHATVMPDQHAPVTVQLIAGIGPGCTGGVGGHLYLILSDERKMIACP